MLNWLGDSNVGIIFGDLNVKKQHREPTKKAFVVMFLDSLELKENLKSKTFRYIQHTHNTTAEIHIFKSVPY